MMARLKSELDVVCPCCQATLVVDTNLGRVVSHKEPERGNKPELSEAQPVGRLRPRRPIHPPWGRSRHARLPVHRPPAPAHVP